VVEIYRLKITLQDCKPAIWREVEVASNMTLSGLHGVLQTLLGWDDSHLWAFEVGDKRFEIADSDARTSPPAGQDPDRVTLGALLAGKGAGLRYNYDFGDDWWVDVKVLAVGKPEPKVHYPRCLAGDRAGPPEDCGGPPGFEELLAARKNPRSRQAKELLDWAGLDWDPAVFDLAMINKALAALPASRRLH
jgi:hypothetical protein